jgi:putative flippase GtrA
MTCSILARPAGAHTEVGQLRSEAGPALRTSAQWLRDGDAAPAQLARFALTGGLSTSVQVLLFTLLAPIGALTANGVAWAVSTALANELHRRRTFHADAQVGWFAAQWEGGGLALLGLAITSSALAALTVAAPTAAVAVQVLLVLAVNASVGGLRFLALRWAFSVRPREA